MIDLVLVDEQNNELGTMERLSAHQNPGRLHRAISIVLFRKKAWIPDKASSCLYRDDGKVEVLIQKRSEKKPLWPLYWANTVCTHPLPQETNLHCAVRRLNEEIGVNMREEDLHELFSFTYQADYNRELSEHEFDTVIVGEWDGTCQMNPDEVSEMRWVGVDALKKDLIEHPEMYAPWPKYILGHKEFQL